MHVVWKVVGRSLVFIDALRRDSEKRCRQGLRRIFTKIDGNSEIFGLDTVVVITQKLAVEPFTHNPRHVFGGVGLVRQNLSKRKAFKSKSVLTYLLIFTYIISPLGHYKVHMLLLY